MATGQMSRNCTIVLHDDAISKEDVLCGNNILSTDEVGFLVAPNAKAFCIAPSTSAKTGDEVSIHVSIAKRFGFENRTKAKVQVLENEDDAVATHVEITFRDQHLSRADMWRMKAEAEGRAVYQGQKVKYLGSTAAEVASVYIAGQEVDSAIILHPRTKFIFRSASARYTILIQISKEMLQYWYGGDLMYERLISGFLPDLFKRWETMKVRHQVTFVLFGRRISSHASNEVRDDNAAEDGGEAQPLDFFHVLTSDKPSTEWKLMLRNLKQAVQSPKLPQDVCLAAEGNLLEAMHLVAMDFADDNLAPPVASTGTSIIAVTGGAGSFEVDHMMLKRTTELLLGNSIGVDIVSLSPKPLHPVPLIQYKLQDHVEYALPHWLDISYWPINIQSSSPWLFHNCNEDATRVSASLLDERITGVAADLASTTMTKFDENVFASSDNALEQTKSSETVVNTSIESDGGNGTSSTASNRPVKDIEATLSANKPASKVTARIGSENDKPSSSSTASVPLMSRAKREGLPPHPLMQNLRKISVGPKGLAPSQSVASTTLSAHHVQQERDAAPSVDQPNENPSLLARQIRASLNQKPSQRTLASHQVLDPVEASKPIAIRTSEDLQSENGTTRDNSDPASVIEKAVMDRDSGPNSGSFSATPRVKRGSLPITGLSSFDTQDGSNTPWLTLLNPYNPKRDNMRIASEYRKWQNVFPRAVSSGAFKWDSMCTPASLPLMTEVRVSMTDLEKHFTKKVRRILITPGATPALDGAQDVLHQLITLRLSAGFQIVPTRRLRKEQTASDHIDRILLALGSYYHELRCLSQAEVQVSEYERPTQAEANGADTSSLVYAASVRSVLSRKMRQARVTLGFDSLVQDWSALDDQCANPSASADELGVCKMRFALLPVQPSNSERNQLSDEERRIDGIQRLTLMWQRHRHVTAEDQQHQASMARPKGAKADRDPNPLAIEYHTRDPSGVVSGQLSGNSSATLSGDESPAIFSEAEMYHSSNFDITKLVKHMQDPPPNGVEVKDRRWFTRLHFKCFRGDEMCNWLLRVFKDLETREDAVALGNQLMDREIFTHVRGKHEFRDGHYLYQIKFAHRTTDYPDNAGLFSKGIGKSVPSTPAAEIRSPILRAGHVESDSSSKGTATPTMAPIGQKEKKAVLLTEKLRYNVDPNKRSDQLEVVNLHYDRIHNPDNCYGIRLDWTNTTPRLIRESVARWASTVEGHGLKLVQLPMKEACIQHEQHPFDLTVPVKLAVRPPKRVPATPLLDPHGGASPSVSTAEDPAGYHKALLRKLDFVLDLEAARSFSNKSVDVSYSWGKPDFTLTQFVHKSGLLLVQIANDSAADFLLLPNRLAPASAPYPPASSGKKAETIVRVEDIANRLKAFCRNEEGLKAFYEEEGNKRKAGVVASPLANAHWAVNEDVPPMELPPHLG